MKRRSIIGLLSLVLFTGCAMGGAHSVFLSGVMLLALVWFSAGCLAHSEPEDPLIRFLRLLSAVKEGEVSGCSSVQDYPNFDLATDLTTTGDGFRLIGHGGHFFSYDVHSPGDINGDGITDLLISSYTMDELGRGAQTGGAYVVFGREGKRGDVTLNALSSADGFRIDGAAAGNRAGRSVDAAGDINGDGIDDLLIGAYGVDALARGANTGAVYVIFGKTSGWSNVDLAALSSSAGFRIDGAVNGDFTYAGATADFNGDGFDDILIGAKDADPYARSAAGTVYVIFGKSNFSGNIDLLTLSTADGFKINGPALNDQVGRRGGTGSAGDVNGDGIEDLLIGAREGATAGQAWVIFGQAGAQGDIDLAALSSAKGFQIDGVALNDFVGKNVAGGADFNGDGLDDFVVSADSADRNGVDSGAVYLFYGKTSGFASLNVSSFSASDGVEIIGQTGYSLGYSLGFADMNGDGLADLAMGAFLADGKPTNNGNISVLFGQRNATSSFILSTTPADGFVLEGAQANDLLGGAATMADINGDNCSDLIVSAASAPAGGGDGYTYVWYGGRTN